MRVLLKFIRWISLISTAVDLGALPAHQLKRPNKLTLSGPLSSRRRTLPG